MSCTPLRYAAGLGEVNAATVLLEAGATVGAIDHHGHTPLDYIVTGGSGFLLGSV